MNLFQLATRGVDLGNLPDEEAPRQGVAFEPSTNGGKFSVPADLNDAFEFAAKDFNIDPDVLRAVAYAESRFHPDVVSGKVRSKTGATGLMQFMPETAQEYGIDPLDPVQSIFGAAAYLRKSLDKFDGDYGKAVASYNAGHNRKDFDAEDWDARMPAETQGYLRTVFTAADQLKSGKAERPLPQGVAPSKAGAGRGVVNPTLGAPVTDTGDETARLAARYKAPDAPQQGGFIQSVGDFFKPAPTSVLESYKPTAAEQQAANAQRLRYGAGPIKGDVLVAANEVASGNANSSSPTVNAVAKQMQERGDTFTGYAQSKNTPILKEGARDAKAAEFRSAGEWAIDTMSAAAQGGVSIPLLPLSIFAPGSDLAKTLRSWRDAWSEQESDVLKAQRAVLKERIENEEGFADKYAATVMELVTNPALGLSEAVKQVPNFLAVMGAARLVGAVAGGAFAVAERSSPALALSNALTSGGMRAGTQAVGVNAGGLAASALMTSGDAAGDVYESLTDPRKTPKSTWEKNEDYQALIAKGVTHKNAVDQIATAKAQLAAMAVLPLVPFGFMGADAAIASKGIVGLAASFGPKAAAKTFGKEIIGETIEEGGTKLGGNLVAGTVNPEIKWDEGVAEAAATATVTSAPIAGLAARSQLSAPPAQTQDPRNGLIAAGLLDPQTYDGGIVGAAGTANPLLEQLKRKPAPTVESQPTTPTVPPSAPTAPAADATQAVDNIAALLRQTEENIDGASPVDDWDQTLAEINALSDGSGQSESAQSLTDAPSRLRRIEALNTERSAIARQLEAQGQSIGDDPLGKAIQAATSPLATRDADWLLEALTYSEQTNRTDIAQEVKLRLTELADKLEAESVTDSVTPGVATDNPKYETIAANLRARRESKGLTADAIRARLKSQQAGALTVPEKGSAVIPSVETGQSLAQRLTKPATPEQEQAHADTVVAEKAKPAPAYTPAIPQPGQAESIVGKAVESARKNADLADERMYSVDALQRIAAHPKADAELKAAATNEVQRRAGIEHVKQQQFEARRSGTVLSIPDAPPLRPLSVERGIEIAKASRERKLLPQEQGYMDALKAEIGDKAFDLVTRAGKAPFMTTMTERKFDLPRLLEQNNSALTQWDTAHNPAQKPTAAPKAAPTPAPAPTGIGAEMAALKARSQPAVKMNLAPALQAAQAPAAAPTVKQDLTIDAASGVATNTAQAGGKGKKGKQKQEVAVAAAPTQRDKTDAPAIGQPSKMDGDTVSSLMPFNIAGQKSHLLAESIGGLFETAARTARRVIDAFGGAGTYTHYLRANGIAHDGDILNEFDSMRASAHRQIAKNPDAVKAAVTKFTGEIYQEFKRLGLKHGDLFTSDSDAARKALGDWVRSRLDAHVLQEPAPGKTSLTMRDSPELAGMYLVLQKKAVNKIPFQAERTKKTGRIKIPGFLFVMTKGGEKPQGSRVKLGGTVSLFKQDAMVREIHAQIDSAAQRVGGMDVRTGDGWALIANEARDGDLATVDTSYLNKVDLETGKVEETMNYSGDTEEDADPNTYKSKVEKYLLPAWERGAKLLITNNWDDDVAAYLSSQGFDVRKEYRKGAKLEERTTGAAELIAINFDPATGRLTPKSRGGNSVAAGVGRSIGGAATGQDQQRGIADAGTDTVRPVAPKPQGQGDAVSGPGRGTDAGIKASRAPSTLQSVLGYFDYYPVAFPIGYKDSTPRDIEIGIADIVPTQDSLKGSAVEQYARDDGGLLPEVVLDKSSGRYILLDGHHRVAGAVVRGDDTVQVTVVGSTERATAFSGMKSDMQADWRASFPGDVDRQVLDVVTGEQVGQGADVKASRTVAFGSDDRDVMFSRGQTTEAPDAGLYRYYSARTWNNEAEAKEMIRRRIVEENEQYAGIFKPTDPAIVDGLKFDKAPTTKTGPDKGRPKVMLKQPKASTDSFSRIGNPVDSEGGSRPGVDWESKDMADDGTAESVLQAYGRGKGNVYRAWVDTGDIPAPKGSGIRNGYPEEDGDYDWSELQSKRSAPPPLKLRVGKNGKLVLMDGNHRLAWWRDQGYSQVPAYVIDERPKSASVPFSRQDTTESPRTPASTIRQAITKAYGNLLPRLEGKGLVTLTQTEEEAIAAAAQARADKTGGDVEVIKAQLRKSVLASVAPQTESENFKRWFGDSQVVDAAGRPLVVFHGSPQGGFDTFDVGNVGAFFSSRYDIAASYAGRYDDVEMAALDEDTYDENQGVYSTYLQIKSPMVVDWGGKDWGNGPDGLKLDDVANRAKRAGHDGLIVENVVDSGWLAPGLVDDKGDGNVYVVFKPEQIKSSTDNNGDFDPNNLDIRRSADGNLEGFFDPATGKSFLIADNLTAESAPATLMHEVGIHMAAEGKFGPMFDRALTVLNDGSLESTEALRRMQESGETSGEEAAAYLVTVYETNRTNAPASVKQWMKDMIAAVRAWLFAKGVIIKADQLTVADIAAVARANASRMARGDGKGDVRYSKQPTQRNQTETPEFKRWFAGSRVVDTDGNPLVVYHGSGLSISEFFSYRGKLIYFSKDIGTAESYAEYADENQREQGNYDDEFGRNSEDGGAAVYPVYLSVQNPFDPDSAAHLTKLPESIAKEIKRTKGDYDTIEQYQGDIEAAGFDGVYVREHAEQDATESRDIAVFSPTQIKSAIGNNGDFDGNNPDIRRSVRGGGQGQLFPQQAVTTWDDMGDSKVDSLIYEGQDDRIDLKRVQENIAKAGRQVREEFDARMAETLFPGRVAKRNESFVDHEVKPLLQAMSASNVSMEELGDYLLARHAPERNAQIAKVNPDPDMQDGGAGTNSQGVRMTTQAANDYIAALTTGKRTALQLLARQVDAITKGTREMLVTEGLEKASTVAAWEGAYQNYVPLFKDEAAETPGHPVGSGFSVKGGASKRAMGSTKEVTNVLAHVLMQREAAITRAEKNRVAMSLYGLALTNPNKAFWGTVVPKMSTPEIIAELQNMGVSVADAFAGMEATPTIRYVDPNTGLVTERPNPVYKNLDNALVVKVDGEDRVILFNKNNARAMRLAESLKNQNRGSGVFVEGTNLVAPVTRFMASMLTQYNPAFGMVNAVRDIQGALVNLSSTPLKGKQAKVLADVPAALKGIARDVSGNVNRTQWSDLWVQFQEDGGRTGIRDLVSDPYEKAGQIEKDLKRLSSTGKLTPGNAAHAVLDLLSGFNDTLENGVRVAAYKAALDQGMSRPAAAKLARELTVDFNRKGRTGRELGKLYAFLNASVQGSARTIQTLKGPMGAKIMAGGFAIGVLQALMLAWAGFDDDDIPEFIKSRNLIIPMGGDRYVTIPMALGLHVLPNTGRAVTELVMSGGKDIGTKSLNTLVEIVTSFNPFGGGGDWKSAHGPLTMVTPTVMDPVIDMAMNRDFTGRQISKERRNPGDVRPGATMAREGTKKSPIGQVYISLSELINKVTLGTDVTKGAWSPTPEELRYMATVLGGGVYRETERAVNAAVLLARGEEVKPHQVPLGSRFAGTLDEEMSTMSRYYKNDEALNKFWSEFRAEAKDGNTERVAEMRKDPRYIAAAMNSKIEQNISKLNKLASENVGDKAKYEELNQRRAELMRKVNEAVKEAESK